MTLLIASGFGSFFGSASVIKNGKNINDDELESLQTSNVGETTLYPPWDNHGTSEEHWQELAGEYHHEKWSTTTAGYAWGKVGSIFAGKAYEHVKFYHSESYIAKNAGYHDFTFHYDYDGFIDSSPFNPVPYSALTSHYIKIYFKAGGQDHWEIIDLKEEDYNDQLYEYDDNDLQVKFSDIQLSEGSSITLYTRAELWVYVACLGIANAICEGQINGCLKKIVVKEPAPPPEIELTPSSYNFGEVKEDECSSEKSFTLKNIGGGTAKGSVDLSGSQFEITQGKGSFDLDEGETKTIKVRFCPTSTGDMSGTLKATGSNCNTEISGLSGEGTPRARSKNSINIILIEKLLEKIPLLQRFLRL